MFIVDEDELFDGSDDESVVARISNFADLLGYLMESQEEVYCCNDIYESFIADGIQLMDVVFSGALPELDSTMRQLLLNVIQRCLKWDDPDLVGTQFQGWSSKRFLYHGARNGEWNAAVAMRVESNVLSITEGDVAEDIYYLEKCEDYQAFFEWVLLEDGHGKEAFIGFARKAFPNLIFLENIENQISNFRDQYLVPDSLLVKHLSGLNKYFLRIFRENPRDTKNITTIQGCLG